MFQICSWRGVGFLVAVDEVEGVLMMDASGSCVGVGEV